MLIQLLPGPGLAGAEPTTPRPADLPPRQRALPERIAEGSNLQKTKPKRGQSDLAKQSAKLDLWYSLQPGIGPSDLAQHCAKLYLWHSLQPNLVRSDLAKQSSKLDLVL